ncbi:Superoxide dismutase [Tieghemiomyces parasiticus]|uniref:Superoxide dismutase n=1 Tax=Tieghemiomyces parasiticus TaxID=78921 RepID=A0A9W8DIV6_9FUNG|nr:Superoxide dismutase [Tieghemiomyces parasiticus]
MKFLATSALLALASATVNADTKAKATFTGAQSGIAGCVEFSPIIKCGSSGSAITVNLQGFQPSDQGPFKYHIHALPVPADGNCTATSGHYNPTNIVANTTCVPSNSLATCEIGDLSGKHGSLNPASSAVPIVGNYVDSDVSVSSVTGLSVVIHAANGTRVACANIVAA